MAIPRKGSAKYMGGTRVKFIWPCGHYRIEDYSKKPIPKRMGEQGCRMMAKYWDKDRGGHVNLPPCPTCEKHLIKPKRIKVGGRVKDHIKRKKIEYKEHPHKEVGEKRVCPHTGKRFNNTWSAKKVYDSCIHCNPKEYMSIGQRLHKINEQRKNKGE